MGSPNLEEEHCLGQGGVGRAQSIPVYHAEPNATYPEDPFHTN